MRFARTLIGYIAGILSGMMIFQGLVVLLGRDGTFGGEILIIPLIVILFFFGWDMGKQYGGRKAFQCGRDKGFIEGFEEGYYEGQRTGKARILMTEKDEVI